MKGRSGRDAPPHPKQTATGNGWPRHMVCGLRKAFSWAWQNLPPGLRFVSGLLLIVGGLFGFLPILGFWMIPAGVVVASLDIPPLRRWIGRKLEVHGEQAPESDGPA